jgi:hypothetical protein
MLSVAVKTTVPLIHRFHIKKLIHVDLLPFNCMGGTTVAFVLMEIHGRQHLCNFIAKLLVVIELSRDLGVAFLKSLSI